MVKTEQPILLLKASNPEVFRDFFLKFMELPVLKKGAKIGVIAPAGRVLKGDLDSAQQWCTKQGWELYVPETLYAEHFSGYWYAGNTEHRLNLTQNLLNDPNLEALWCARGGYGSIKIIDSLDFSLFRKNPKWLIGYSDITVFHNYLSNKGIPSLHAITAKPLNNQHSEESYRSLRSALTGEPLKYTLPNHCLNQPGKATGILAGGNLSIIYSQLGSSTALKGKNIILFIEDWYENWYHIDRMLEALKRSGLFSNVRGVIVGSFTKMDIKEENPHFNAAYDTVAYDIIHSHLKELCIPVMYQFPAGHINDNRALIMGAMVELKVTSISNEISFF